MPKKAEAALSSVKELQFEISKARSSVLAAKAMGKDVTAAEADLESARTDTEEYSFCLAQVQSYLL